MAAITDNFKIMRVIIGLGNPGQEYENTRHNAGFMAIDYLAKKLGLDWQVNKKFTSLFAKTDDLMLLKPQTYMNNSGKTALAALSYYNLLPKKLGLFRSKNIDLSQILTVIHDDLDIEFGKYKTSFDSRSAGHRGVESIINLAKTKNFKRIRIGIKTDMLGTIPAEKFVMQKFTREELALLTPLIKKISTEI